MKISDIELWIYTGSYLLTNQRSPSRSFNNAYTSKTSPRDFSQLPRVILDSVMLGTKWAQRMEFKIITRNARFCVHQHGGFRGRVLLIKGK